MLSCRDEADDASKSTLFVGDLPPHYDSQAVQQVENTMSSSLVQPLILAPTLSPACHSVTECCSKAHASFLACRDCPGSLHGPPARPKALVHPFLLLASRLASISSARRLPAWVSSLPKFLVQVFAELAPVESARVVGTQCYAFVRFTTPAAAAAVMEVRNIRRIQHMLDNALLKGIAWPARACFVSFSPQRPPFMEVHGAGCIQHESEWCLSAAMPVVQEVCINGAAHAVIAAPPTATSKILCRRSMLCVFVPLQRQKHAPLEVEGGRQLRVNWAVGQLPQWKVHAAASGFVPLSLCGRQGFSGRCWPSGMHPLSCPSTCSAARQRLQTGQTVPKVRIS